MKNILVIEDDPLYFRKIKNALDDGKEFKVFPENRKNSVELISKMSSEDFNWIDETYKKIDIYLVDNRINSALIGMKYLEFKNINNSDAIFILISSAPINQSQFENLNLKKDHLFRSSLGIASIIQYIKKSIENLSN